MSTVEELDKKISELALAYKLHEFNAEFSKFKVMVVSGFTVFCILFAGWFGFEYYQIPKRIDESLKRSIDEKIGKDVSKRLDDAKSAAEVVINASAELSLMRREVASLKSENLKLRASAATFYTVTFTELKDRGSLCEKSRVYMPACMHSAHKYCQDVLRAKSAFGVLMDNGTDDVLVACVRGDI